MAKCFLSSKQKIDPYIELEYIESFGSQYIDTGVYVNSNYRVIDDIQFKSIATYNGTYCSPNWFSYGTNTSYWVIYYGSSSSAGLNPTPVSFSRITIDFDGKNKIFKYGSNSWTLPSRTFNAGSESYTLFALNRGSGTINANVSCIYWGCKIYNESDVLVREFVPALSTLTWKAGLWDKVEKKFYPNLGTGEFEYAFKNDKDAYKAIKEIEYLESSGGQGIDTLYTPNNNTKLEMSIDNNLTSSKYIYGAKEDLRVKDFSLKLYPAGSTAYQAFFGNTSADCDPATTGKLTITQSVKGITINSVTRTFTDNAFTAPNTLLLFGRNLPGGGGYIAVIKLYYCNLHDNGTKIRQYIPIKVGSTGYLYDELNRRVYVNRGTGDFICGPEV